MTSLRIKESNLIPLIRSYDILLPLAELRKLVKSIFPGIDSENYERYKLHKIINDAIIKNYSGEVKIKALLVDHFIKDNAVSCFEIKANKSRLDFLRINGTSISYEIKSELDTLIKLEKQVSDYSELFEYNYVVIHENHLKNATQIIPSNYGIVNVSNGKFEIVKEAKRNKNIMPSKQIALLTKKEIENAFNISKQNINKILVKYDMKEINEAFKETLKKRYIKKWEFLVSNKEAILPIDYQFFFRNNILPEIIYGKVN